MDELLCAFEAAAFLPSASALPATSSGRSWLKLVGDWNDRAHIRIEVQLEPKFGEHEPINRCRWWRLPWNQNIIKLWNRAKLTKSQTCSKESSAGCIANRAVSTRDSGTLDNSVQWIPVSSKPQSHLPSKSLLQKLVESQHLIRKHQLLSNDESNSSNLSGSCKVLNNAKIWRQKFFETQACNRKRSVVTWPERCYRNTKSISTNVDLVDNT